MTQKELASFLEVTPKAVSFYELNQREPSGDILIKIAKKFNVYTDYLLGHESELSSLSNYAGKSSEKILKGDLMNNLAKLRKERRLTQAEVAEDLNINWAQVFTEN